MARFTRPSSLMSREIVACVVLIACNQRIGFCRNASGDINVEWMPVNSESSNPGSQ